MKVTFIYHSCFVVTFEKEKYALIFDYFKGELPDFPEDYTLLFFVSHKHYDHYTREIFQYVKEYARCYFILANDMKMSEKYMDRWNIPAQARSRIIYAKVRERFTLPVGEITVETIKSSDAGVAYAITAFGRSLYHAGDHNLWLWDEDDAQSQLRKKVMNRLFFGELKRLEGRCFDVAFLPLDGRLGPHFHEGFDAFMKLCGARQVYPMHMWDDTSVIERLRQMECACEYRDRIVAVAAEKR